MQTEPTLEQINGALEELELLMADCEYAKMEIFTALYAKAYMLKLRLMKEKPHASH
jgi:hypothetical protein